MKKIDSNEVLGENQQVLLAFSLFNLGNPSEESPELLKLYYEFLLPILEKNDFDNQKIQSRFSHTEARSGFVQFADRLVEKGCIEEALKIVRCFIADPNPDVENDLRHQEICKGESSSVLGSIRGWCAWVVGKSVCLKGRDNIPELIEMTRVLISDKNYYVKKLACRALSGLVQNRLFTIPNGQELFFDQDLETALQRSKEVEAIAFALLEDAVSWDRNVQLAIGADVMFVVSHLYHLTESDAFKLVDSIRKFPDLIVAKAALIFVYFAELRGSDFQNWKWQMPGLYDDLQPFDMSKFEEIFLDVINKISPEYLRELSQFLHYMMVNEPKYFGVGIKYFELLVKRFNPGLYSSLYWVLWHLIQRNDRFTDSYRLLLLCLEEEGEYYRKFGLDFSQQADMSYYPSPELIQIITFLGRSKDTSKFISVLELVLKFPLEVPIWIHEELCCQIKSVASQLSENAKQKLKQRNSIAFENL